MASTSKRRAKGKSKAGTTKARSKGKGKSRASRKDTQVLAQAAINPDIQPAPKNGPTKNIRMRSDEQYDRIKEAAKKAHLTINTWMVEVLDQAAAAQ